LEQLVYPEYDPEIGAQVIGFEAPISLELAGVNKDSPAEKAGLMKGDRIVSVGGKEPRGGTEIYELINASVDRPLKLVVERKEENKAPRRVEAELTPEPVYRYDVGLRCTSPPEVLEVGALSPADRAGLKAGDRIVSIDGRLIRTWSELTEITSRSADQPLSLVVVRKGESVSLVVTPRRRPDDWRARMGIVQPEALIGEVLPGSPAAQAGVMSGDRVRGLSWTIEERIPGKSDSPGAAQEVTLKEVQVVCDSWGTVEEVVQQRGAQPITFLIDRGGTRHEPVLTPERTDEVVSGSAGFVPQPEQVLRKYSLPRACLVGFRKAVLWAGSTYLTLRRILITGSVSPRSIGGPVAIFTLSYRLASKGLKGFVKFLYWLGMLGVWFAVFNLLPVPILDGGHIVVAAVEKIKGSRLSERTLILVQLTGLVLIISLMVFVTLNDILRLPQYLGH
jgi:regulator of sigma E protease